MQAPAVRPSLILQHAEAPEQLLTRLRLRLPTCPECSGISVGNHAELFVPEAHRRLWSPHLSVSMEERSKGGSLVRLRFGPHPQLWTLYIFLAFGLGFAMLVGLSWGYAQWVMEQSPWALLSLPVGIVLGAGLYAASMVGQRLGAEQMTHLHQALEMLLEDEAERQPRP